MNYKKYLENINKKFCNEDNVINPNNEFSFNIINRYIISTINEKNNNYVIFKALKVAALIKLYQPFYDANNRTAVVVFGDLIRLFGYTFNYEEALKDLQNNTFNIPTIYSEEDEIKVKNNILKYISVNSENKKSL